MPPKNEWFRARASLPRSIATMSYESCHLACDAPSRERAKEQANSRANSKQQLNNEANRKQQVNIKATSTGNSRATPKRLRQQGKHQRQQLGQGTSKPISLPVRIHLNAALPSFPAARTSRLKAVRSGQKKSSVCTSVLTKTILSLLW